MVLSRRKFLTQLAALGGTGVALAFMQALGLASAACAPPEPLLPCQPR